jgi:hypothetical protein
MFYLIKNEFNDLKVALRVSNDEAATFGEPIIVTREPGYPFSTTTASRFCRVDGFLCRSHRRRRRRKTISSAAAGFGRRRDFGSREKDRSINRSAARWSLK